MKEIIQAVFIMTLFSCYNDNLKKNKNDITIALIENPQMDEKCKSQLDIYLKSVNGLNADKATEMTYDGVFDYLKKQYPEEYSIQKIKSIMIESIIELKIKMDKKNVKQEFLIEDVKKRISFDGKLIYLIKTTSILKKNSKIIDKFSDESIGISFDEGVNWKFLGTDSIMSAEILKKDLPKEVIDEIF